MEPLTRRSSQGEPLLDAVHQLTAISWRAVDVEHEVLERQVRSARDVDVHGHRTTITGQWAWWATRSAVEPSR